LTALSYDFEIIAVEVKDIDPEYTCEIVGIYRAPNEGIRVTARLAARTGFLGNSMRRSIIGVDLNLRIVDWKGVVDVTCVTQTFIIKTDWFGATGTLRGLVNRHVGTPCWTNTWFDPKVNL
jgi:hypothetical protein